MTVFLTTQYLEEADVLADRVGIIDHGHIVAEGTPAALKAEIGRPTVEVVPADPAERDRAAAILARFGEPVASVARRRRPAAARARPTSPRSCARSTPSTSRVEQLQLHQPSLDDVFLAKTGRSLEGADDDGDEQPSPGSRWSRRDADAADQVYLLARRSVVRTLRQPANMIAPLVFPLMLLAVNSAGLRAETHIARLPDRARSSPSSSPCRSSRARCSRR